jgi:hypothetical protein
LAVPAELELGMGGALVGAALVAVAIVLGAPVAELPAPDGAGRCSRVQAASDNRTDTVAPVSTVRRLGNGPESVIGEI